MKVPEGSKALAFLVVPAMVVTLAVIVVGRRVASVGRVAFLMKEISQHPGEAKEEALKHPNGYVYVIDKEYQGKSDVPRTAIAGAWKVDENGIIVGRFIPNPNYQETSP